jgi:RHS repeat-associated protein
VKLYGMMTSGWVTFDDVSLRACSSGGQGAPGGGGVAGIPAPPSPEELLSQEQPQWRIEEVTACEDGPECPPGAIDLVEEPMQVEWTPVDEQDGAIARELLGQKSGERVQPEAGVDSSTSKVKRYLFGGRVVAMRRGDTLYFLSPDHLGSASLVLDEDGRWLADHRFWPYGETKRMDGASEYHPTDRLFTGMMFRERLGIYRMGARWYDPYLARWLSADTLVPDPGDPQSFNRYSYAIGNPLRHTDPSGHGACGGDDYDPACEEDIPPIIWYIYWEMLTNADSEMIELLLSWNESSFSSSWRDMPNWMPGIGEARSSAALADAAAKAEAFALFGYMVRQGGPWDPKPEIGRGFGYLEEIEGDKYYYDIWGNIMFGYLGTSAGFSESELLEGAGLEQVGSSIAYAISLRDPDYLPKREPGVSGARAWDDPVDQIASQIGINLWNSYGLYVTPMNIMQAITSEPRIPEQDGP